MTPDPDHPSMRTDLLCSSCTHTWSHHQQHVSSSACVYDVGDQRPCWTPIGVDPSGQIIECGCETPIPSHLGEQ